MTNSKTTIILLFNIIIIVILKTTMNLSHPHHRHGIKCGLIINYCWIVFFIFHSLAITRYKTISHKVNYNRCLWTLMRFSVQKCVYVCLFVCFCYPLWMNTNMCIMTFNIFIFIYKTHCTIDKINLTVSKKC